MRRCQLDTTLQVIAEATPRSIVCSSTNISSVGPAKLDRYGNEVLVTLEEAVAS